MNEATPVTKDLFNNFNFQTFRSFPLFFTFSLLLEFSSNKKAEKQKERRDQGARRPQRLRLLQLGDCNRNAGGDNIIYDWGLWLMVMQLNASRVPVSPPRVGVEWFGTETAAKMCGRMHSPPRKTKLAIIFQQPPDFKPAPPLLHNFRTETP